MFVPGALFWPCQRSRAPYSSLLRTNTLFVTPPPAIFTEVPYIPTYPWPRCLYMTVLKIANDFFVCGMLCRRKITGWYFPSFPDVFIIYRFFWGAGRFSICWLSLFFLDIFFQNCWLRYGLKRPLLLSTEKCSEIIVLHLLSPRPSF